MRLPNYFLPQPPASWDVDTTASFERLLDAWVSPSGGGGGAAAAAAAGAEIPYTLAAPKWQFLSYVGASKNVVLHGSGDPSIGEFEPRKAQDVADFGNRRAVYATSDGIWAMYFAVVDRGKHVSSLVNACFRVVTDSGAGPPYYYFSVNGDALPHHPWRAGTVYLLPRDTFELQPRLEYRGHEIAVAQWASAVAVKPLARLRVGPEDFPFLDRIVAHDPAVLRERARADPDGFPWHDE
jgi:hypothetical protein